MKRISLMIILMIFATITSMAVKSYEMEVLNLVQVNETEFKFDVRMRNTNASDPFAIESIQWQLSFNTALMNGGSLNNANLFYVDGTTDLVGTDIIPKSVNISTNQIVIQWVTAVLGNGGQTTLFNNGDWKRIGTFRVQLRNAGNTAFHNFGEVAPNLAFVSGQVIVSWCNYTTSGGLYYRDGAFYEIIAAKTLTNSMSSRLLAGYCFSGTGAWGTTARWNNITTANANTLPGASNNAIVIGSATVSELRTVKDLTIANGGYLVISPVGQLTADNLYNDNTGGGGSGTVTIAGWDFQGATVGSTLPIPFPADHGIPANLNSAPFQVVSATLANYFNFSATGGTIGARANSWYDDMEDIWGYWKVSLSTIGYNNLKLSSKQWNNTSNSPPTTFQIQWSIDNSNWTSVGNLVNPAYNWTSGVTSNLTLPSDLNDHATVYIRWLASGGVGTGYSAIDDILITGEPLPTGMLIQSTSGGTGSLLNNSAGVTATVERYLTTCVGSTGTSCWHYVASPITNAVSAVFKDDYLRWYNTLNGAWSSEYTQLNYPLTVMKGFAISEQGSAGTPPHTNHYFTGELNTSVPAYSLALTGSTGLGWNLVGNPYPSAIDIESSGITWNNVQSTVWFLQKSSGNYLVYPKGGSGATTTQYIPSMQGFFVYANGTSPSITFSNTARVHNNTAYYKEYLAPNTQDVLYLKAQRVGSELYDLVSVVFRDYTSVNYEDIYDAQKLYGSAEAPQLYTVSADNVSLTINSLPFTGKNNTIPLNLNIFENGSGNYAITASNLESFRSGTTIMIEDKKEAKTQDLTFNPVYNFTYASGDDPARFLLHFANPFFSTGEDVKNQDLQIYSFGNSVYLKDLTGNPEKGEMFIYNMIGQEISHNQVDGIQLNKYTFDLPTGYYIVRVITKEKSFNSRVFLN